MLCWLAFGEHEALKRNMIGVGILIPVWGKQTSTARIFPTPPWEAQMLCWLTFGEHEAFKRDMTGVAILILVRRKPTSTARIFPTGSRDNALRRATPWEAQMLAG